jgi:hypothetical protein
MARTPRKPRNPALDDRVRALQTEIEELRTTAELARSAESFGPAVNARTKLAELVQTLAALKAEQRAGRSTDVGTVSALIAETRALRVKAERAESFVAAQKLLSDEIKLTLGERARAEAEAAAQRSDMTEDQLVDELVLAITSLPPSLRARLRAAAFEDLDSAVH